MHYKVNIREIEYRPYMTKQEIEIFSTLLLTLKPKRILEWGAGYSTLFYSQLIPCKWFAIESNPEWFQKIKQKNTYNNVKIKLIEPERKPGVRLRDSFGKFIKYPSGFDKFDLVLVDGLSITRKNCIRFAPKILNNSGVLILHDSDRKQYHNIFKVFPYHIRFAWKNKKGRSTGGLWIASFNKIIIRQLSNDLPYKDHFIYGS